MNVLITLVTPLGISANRQDNRGMEAEICRGTGEGVRLSISIDTTAGFDTNAGWRASLLTVVDRRTIRI